MFFDPVFFGIDEKLTFLIIRTYSGALVRLRFKYGGISRNFYFFDPLVLGSKSIFTFFLHSFYKAVTTIPLKKAKLVTMECRAGMRSRRGSLCGPGKTGFKEGDEYAQKYFKKNE